MMRKLLFVTAVVAFLVFNASPGGASQKTERVSFPVAGGTEFNPCTGTTVTFNKGTFQIVTHTTIDKNGGIHIIAEGNGQGVSATDSNGTVYSMSGGFWAEFNTNGGTQETFTITSVFNMVSRGSAEDFHQIGMFHFNVSSTGQVNFQSMNWGDPESDPSVKCRG